MLDVLAGSVPISLFFSSSSSFYWTTVVFVRFATMTAMEQLTTPLENGCQSDVDMLCPSDPANLHVSLSPVDLGLILSESQPVAKNREDIVTLEEADPSDCQLRCGLESKSSIDVLRSADSGEEALTDGDSGFSSELQNVDENQQDGKTDEEISELTCGDMDLSSELRNVDENRQDIRTHEEIPALTCGDMEVSSELANVDENRQDGKTDEEISGRCPPTSSDEAQTATLLPPSSAESVEDLYPSTASSTSSTTPRPESKMTVFKKPGTSEKKQPNTSEKKPRTSEKKRQGGERYGLGEYPMERLAREAFVVEVSSKPVCHVCLDYRYEDVVSGCLLECSGPCKRTVHIQCMVEKQHMPAGWTKIEEESAVNEFKRQQSDLSAFKCEECKTGHRECFECEVWGNDLVRCPDASCGHFYHRACLLGPDADERTKLRPCPAHECHTCKRTGRQAKKGQVSKSLTQCSLCPNAFHFNFICFPTESIICVDNPKYHTCYQHWDSKKMTGNKGIDSKICFTCHEGGELLMCHNCPLTVHTDCAGLDAVPDDDWLCHDCAKGTMPLLLDIVWYRHARYRTWPCQIVPAAVVPDTVKNAFPEDSGCFIMRFLGTNDFAFARSKEVLPYDICDPAWKKNHGKTKGFSEGLLEAKRLSAEVLAIKTRFIDEHFFGVKQPYNKIKVNKAIHPAVYKGIFDRDAVDICDCKETDHDPCGPSSNCLNRTMEYECHPKLCPAGLKCQNQRLRKRIYPNMKVFYTADRGWALKTLQDLKKGDLVIEYVGEIITVEERNKRIQQQLLTGNVNFYYLDLTNNRVIDAGPSGNDARFANHSCDANSSSQKWVVDGETRIALIAIKDIKKDEEITFDYRWEYEANVTSRECLCRAENCQGKIGGKRLCTKPDSKKSKKSGAKQKQGPSKRRKTTKD